MTGADSLAAFEDERRRLTGLAYRMLGSRAEAEDVLQDAWLRWQQVDTGGVESPAAFLTSVVTRLCLDRLKAAKAKREVYVGPWLPEPVVEDFAAEGDAELAADLSVALLLALERLSPLERAAFLLHDVFERDYAEVAQILGRSETACRQLASRARSNVKLERTRFPVAADEGQRYVQAFLDAVMSGSVERLKGMLAEEAVMVSDGGGKKLAALNPIYGGDRIARFFAGVIAKPDRPHIARVRYLTINGLPGVLTEFDDGHLQTTALAVEAGAVATVYVVRNPEKLEHLRPLLDEA